MTDINIADSLIYARDLNAALLKKRQHFYNQRRDILEEANRQIKKIDEEIAKINTTIFEINENVKDVLCPKCKGTGKARRIDAAGDSEEYTCPVCEGSGLKTE